MSISRIPNQTVLYDNLGNPVNVELRNGRYVLSDSDSDVRAQLEQLNTTLADLRDQNTLRPDFIKQGATKLVGADSTSVNVVTPDGAQIVWPRTAMPPIMGWYSIGTTLIFGPSVASGSTVMAFRNGGPNIVGVTRVHTSAAVTTTFTGAQVFGITLTHARQWTVSDGAAFPATVPLYISPGYNFRKRSSYPVSTMADIRTPGTAVLTPGTRTTDSAAAALISGFAGTAAGVLWNDADLYNHGDMTHTPLLYGPNEGFVILTSAAIPAAGVVNISLSVDWFETPVWY